MLINYLCLMMIRSAVDTDIPGIVELLRLSLGESLMPKSEEFWRWKHVANPFGASPVLLAFEKDQLIGVRAFMRWEWKQGNRIFKAVRAVDTATHPQHQGKGIFKKLTLQLVEQCREEGVDFIYNSPNKISKPGYLKMGWVHNRKMKLHIKPVFSWGARSQDFDACYSMANRNFSFASGFNKLRSGILGTHASREFLDWRYGHSPNVQYFLFSDDTISPTYLTIFRLKPYRFGTEFRICDTYQSDGNGISKWRDHLRQVVRESGANLVTSAEKLNLFPEFSFPLGPAITTYPFSLDHKFLSTDSWQPSLGDMEVF